MNVKYNAVQLRREVETAHALDSDSLDLKSLLFSVNRADMFYYDTFVFCSSRASWFVGLRSPQLHLRCRKQKKTKAVMLRRSGSKRLRVRGRYRYAKSGCAELAGFPMMSSISCRTIRRVYGSCVPVLLRLQEIWIPRTCHSQTR